MGVAGIATDIAKTDNAGILADNEMVAAGTATGAAVRAPDVDTQLLGAPNSPHAKQAPVILLHWPGCFL